MERDIVYQCKDCKHQAIYNRHIYHQKKTYICKVPLKGGWGFIICGCEKAKQAVRKQEEILIKSQQELERLEFYSSRL